MGASTSVEEGRPVAGSQSSGQYAAGDQQCQRALGALSSRMMVPGSCEASCSGVRNCLRRAGISEGTRILGKDECEPRMVENHLRDGLYVLRRDAGGLGPCARERGSWFLLTAVRGTNIQWIAGSAKGEEGGGNK